jgi:hypothetical protein
MGAHTDTDMLVDMVETDVETAAPKRNANELATAIILASAALCTAFAGYQADLWRGKQAAYYGRANALRVDASRASLTANQVQGADLMTFSAWLAASASDEHRLEVFYRERFRPHFATVFEAWIALHPLRNSDAPRTPFEMPDYQRADRAHVDALERQASQNFSAGQKANATSNSFVLATVLFANALFFGGLNQISHQRLARKLLLTVAAFSLLGGLAYLVSLPLAN